MTMEEQKISESRKDAENFTDRKQSNESSSLGNNMELNVVHKKLEDLRSAILKDVEQRMSAMIDDVLQELRQRKLQLNEFKNFSGLKHSVANEHIWAIRLRNSKGENRKNKSEQNEGDNFDAPTEIKEKNRERLPEKCFVTRESYLTALLHVKHIKAIYHIFFVIFIMLFMNTIFYDYFVNNRINIGLSNFQIGLEKLDYVFFIWCVEHLVVFALYYAFKGWAEVRSKLLNQKHLLKFWNNSCVIVYISCQVLFIHVASVLCPKLDLPFISASILLLESTRLFMKMHSFVRSNARRILDGKLKSDDAAAPLQVCSFGTYLYFLFAPTLIFRDNYPRTSRINWRFAALRFLEVVAVAFLYSYVHERYIKPNFSDYGREAWSASTIIVKIFGMAMPNMIIFLCGFYLILHSWLNFTAELLRFGDRMFYKDWWTSNSYGDYYRNWNVVVHDWLYEYVFRDCYEHVFKGSKAAAALTVFMISAIVHEYLLSYALQVFLPVMFVFFVFLGIPMVFLMRRFPSNLGNIIFWLTLCIGNGLMITLYSMEYYARFNCSKQYTTWTDYLIPLLWSCNRG